MAITPALVVVGKSVLQGQPWLHSEFKASLYYLTLYLKKKKQATTKLFVTIPSFEE